MALAWLAYKGIKIILNLSINVGKKIIILPIFSKKNPRWWKANNHKVIFAAYYLTVTFPIIYCIFGAALGKLTRK
jgi:hypothetical protein